MYNNLINKTMMIMEVWLEIRFYFILIYMCEQNSNMQHHMAKQKYYQMLSQCQ